MEKNKKNILNNAEIDKTSEAVSDFLSKEKMEKQEILRIRLALEEILMQYQDNMGEETLFSYRCGKRLGKMKIELFFPGARFDPFARDAEEEDDGAGLMRNVMAGMGYAPLWQYKNGVNIITFTPKKVKKSKFQSMLTAVVLAVISGYLCLLLPDSVQYFLSEDLVKPIFDVFMGLLSAVAGPLIFLSVAWGIFSIGDTATLGQIGKRMINRFLIISVVIGVAVTLIYLPFFPLATSGGGGTLNFRELYDLVLDMLPRNLFTPFVENNPTQIVMVGVMLGLALLILGSKASGVAANVEQLNYIVQLLMEAISGMVPFFVFCSIFNIIVSDGLSVVAQAYKLLPLLLLGYVLTLGTYAAAICIRRKVKFTVLIRKMSPSFLIALMTASSMAALSTNIEICKKDLGIDKHIINFGIPLGQVLFMPGLEIKFVISSLCMAEIYDVKITAGWLVTAIFIIVVLAAAAPPVPGGSMGCYTMLFIQLGLPAEAIAIVITLNVILDFLSSPVNLSTLQMELVELSADLDMLDLDILRREQPMAKK